MVSAVPYAPEAGVHSLTLTPLVMAVMASRSVQCPSAATVSAVEVTMSVAPWAAQASVAPRATASNLCPNIVSLSLSSENKQCANCMRTPVPIKRKPGRIVQLAPGKYIPPVVGVGAHFVLPHNQMTMKKLSRTTASLRHLCSLGLSSEMVVPQFLATLAEAMPSDSHHFHWFGDSTLQMVNYYSNLTGSERYLSLFQRLLFQQISGQVEERSSDSGFARWASGAGPLVVDKSADDGAMAFKLFYHEILRPLGGMFSVAAMVHDRYRQQGAISLWRGAGGGFSAREVSYLQELTGYLSYALNAVTTDRALPIVEDDHRGIVLLDRDANIVQIEARAQHLLFLAAHSRVDASRQEHADSFAAPVREMCRNLLRMTEGQPSASPQQFHHNDWGVFGFRAHWLLAPSGDGSGLVAVTVSLHVPRTIKLWRSIHALALPPRQQEVCLLFVQGHSLTDIAQRLGISRHTVIDHMRRIYQRLEVEPDRVNLRDRLLSATALVPMR